QVMPGHEIMLISSTGTLVRTPVDEISVLGRNTQGVRLIRLADGERLVGIERIESLDAPDSAAGGADVAGGESPGTDALPNTDPQ
ncbi:MAG TPA: DNA gyrase C-terminal beta-propeller domain-containing protein, partial [Steroidobacteraceae bacterium]